MYRIDGILCLCMLLGMPCGGFARGFAFDVAYAPTLAQESGPMISRIYFAEDKVRLEYGNRNEDEYQIRIFLFLGDQVTDMTLLPSTHQYRQHKLDRRTLYEQFDVAAFEPIYSPRHPCNSNPQWTCRKLGKEAFLGRAVEVWSIEETLAGEPMQSTIWYDHELGFPLRIEDQDGVLETSHLTIGPQPASLFEIPKDFLPYQANQQLSCNGAAA